jgi:hypothetical protein
MNNSQLHPFVQTGLPRQRSASFLRLGRLFFQAIRTALPGLLLTTVFAGFLALVQFATPDLPDNDGFYHIKLAYLMRTQGLKPDFPWLPLTILNAREFYDHHFLFHVALLPFTFGDLRLGAKWASVVFATLAFLSTWRLLKNQRVPYAWMWALGLLAVSEAFIYRMSITRAQSLSLAVLMLGLDWLLRGKRLHLAILGFVYVWFYNAFPLLLVLSGVIVFSAWLVERRLDLRPLLYTGVGIGLGLILNPYFPDNLVFAYRHILPKLVETTAVSVGNEWYPYDTGQLLANSPLALAVFLSGGLALGMSGKRMDTRTAAGFFLACLFGLMLFQSRRFIEYFPAFSLVFAAFAWAPLFPGGSKAHPDSSAPDRPGLRFISPSRILPILVLVFALLPGAWLTLNGAQSSIQRSKPYGLYAGASAWLAANSAPGARVFQTDWDDFPRLFFYNTHNTYLVGLDPTYLLLQDEGLYGRWTAITRGEVEQPSEAIAAEFGSRYVLIDLNHTDFLAAAEDDPGLIEVYRDEQAVVFQVGDR